MLCQPACLPTCSHACRCFPAELLTEKEEHAGDEERGQGHGARGEQEAVEDEWAAEGACGRLGRAFVEGYNSTKEDFLRCWGYRL